MILGNHSGRPTGAQPRSPAASPTAGCQPGFVAGRQSGLRHCFLSVPFSRRRGQPAPRRHRREGDPTSGGRVVSVAVTVTVGVNRDGRRGVPRVDDGASEAATFWRAFLRELVGRGRDGVKLVISNVHQRLNGGVTRVFGTISQRCPARPVRTVRWRAPVGRASPRRRHRQRVCLGGRHRCQRAGAQGRRSVARQAADACCSRGRGGEQRARLHGRPKGGSHQIPLNQPARPPARRGEATECYARHLARLKCANTRLLGAILTERNDGWAVQRARIMGAKTIAAVRNNAPVGLPAMVDCLIWPPPQQSVMSSHRSCIASRETSPSRGYRGASRRWRRVLARVAVAGRHLSFSLALI